MFHIPDMVKAIRTLGEAAKHRLLVLAECLGCGKAGKFLASDLAQWSGYQKDIHETPFRCTTCESRKFKITCEEIHTERTHEVVVWRPVKLKGASVSMASEVGAYGPTQCLVWLARRSAFRLWL